MKQKGKMSGKKLKQMFVTYTFVLPDFIGLLVFIIIPIIYSFYMSLYDWNFANIKQFIGIQNYVTMFSDSEWWQSLGRTFKLTLLYVPALFILSILFAVLINYVKNEKAAGFVKTAFLLPYSITSVIASCLWMFLYMDRSGFINVFLKAFGLKGEKFLGSTSQAMVCIAVVLIWINLGYNIILFLSAIKDIPYSYYEAAKLDGANSWQTFWKITFPLLKPTSVFVLITSVIASFQCLDLIMVMTGGGPAKSTEVASLYIYKQSFEMMKAGYGAGLSVVMFLILTVLAVIMLKINDDMKKKTNNILAVILIILGIVMLFPIYILFMVSFRNEKTVFVGSLITASPSFESIKSAITPDFLVAIGNSFLIAVAVTIIALILHSMCGYAFARMNFPGKKPMFTVIISTLMIPVSSILVPLFMICKQLGITNSYAGILLPALFNAYGIFLFRQFYMSFPADLEEAAKLDGCSTYRMFFTIIFPLSRPIIIPLSIAFFLGNWNNYLWPLIVNKKPEYRTVMVYLANMVGGYNTKWNVVIASAMLACLPVFLISLLLQSHLQNSIKMSGIK